MRHLPESEPDAGKERGTAVLDVRGMIRASQQSTVAAVLGRRRGVLDVEVNPVAQSATVVFDPRRTSLAELREWVIECGYHCAGQSVPSHICDPLDEPDPSPPTAAAGPATSAEHAPHPATAERLRAPDEAMGHGGHAGMSMAAMVADMRNRFLVALLFSVPIVIWSPIGEDVFGWHAPVPFGLRQDVWALLLSLPVIFYSCTIFFEGAVRALRARTLDMMVLVAVAVGAGWLYSLIVTLTGGGDVFYEAATVLASFVLLGHWFEMRARGGANDAIRALLDLAPPKALVLRDGELVEVATAEVAVGDLLLVRPGTKIAADGVVEEGESEVDESTVTGESLPVHKEPGSPAVGATLNTNGTLRVRATKVGADTALAQIAKLVQEAQNSKAPGQRLADRAAFWLVGVEVVMLTGDNQATAERIAQRLGIDTVIAEVLPGDKAATIAELQRGGRKVAMVGDGVNDAPALAQADLGIAIGAGTDVAIETADLVLMRSDPLDVPTALRIGRGTLRKMRQNLGWAIGYNAIALPIAAGVFEPATGLILRPEIAALSMSGSSIIVALNALALKRLRLPRPAPTGTVEGGVRGGE